MASVLQRWMTEPVPVGRVPDAALSAELPLSNVWLGTSVEDQRWADIRIPQLLLTPAAVRFLSCEPLLGPVDLWAYLELGGIDWVIVGGESGHGARPMNPAWARSLRDQCRDAGVAFFFKQWGGRTPKSGGRVLDGRTWDQMPTKAA
jgi:protein gp37